MRLNLHPLLRNGQLCDRRRHGGVDVFEPKDSVAIYHRHNEWVRKIVPKDRLLEFNPAQGWEPLCDFLGVPAPRDAAGKIMAYPRTNDTAQYRKMCRFLMLIGLLSWLISFLAIFLAARYTVAAFK